MMVVKGQASLIPGDKIIQLTTIIEIFFKCMLSYFQKYHRPRRYLFRRTMHESVDRSEGYFRKTSLGGEGEGTGSSLT